MDHLRKHYRLISLEQMCRELSKPCRDDPAVIVTLDDGYRDTYTHAFPVLRKYGIPATVYLIVHSVETGELPWYDRVFLAAQVTDKKFLELDALGRCSVPKGRARRLTLGGQMVAQLAQLPNDDRRRCCLELERLVPLPKAERTNRMLDWTAVRTMRKEGISFGSHTLTHANVTRLTPAELEDELGTSKAIMERRMEIPVLDFAFPFGRLSADGAEQAKVLCRLGYRSAVTTAGGLNRPGADGFTLRRSEMAEGPGGLYRLSLFALRVERALMYES
jgi:peptidoglycan/xylan/chitin deacetylase (PgdA/CDA1 family)